MKRILVAGLLLALLVSVAPAMAGTLYVDDDDPTCSVNSPCYAHPQDAVNAADPDDTILVFPGIYGSRGPYTDKPPHWTNPNDQLAPALIVYKDGLTIRAVDPDPVTTVIQTTHNAWSNMAVGCGQGGAIERSTGCTFDAASCTWVGMCVRPTYGTAPNGIAIIANDVTIEGFTVISTFQGDDPSGYPNTAGIFIGALYAGDPNSYGISRTTIKNCIARGHSGIRLWKAPDTEISGCQIFNGETTIGLAQKPLEIWDGWCEPGYCEGPNVGSSGLQVLNNEITSYLGTAGISLGGYHNGLMDHGGLYIDGNTISSSGDGVTFWGSGGTPKEMTCNNVVNVPSGYSQVGVWWGTYDGPFGLDSDDDGILDCDELEVCWGTEADTPAVKLGVNRWIWDGADWITVLPKGKGPMVDYTIEQTRGCSCFQILEWLHNSDPVMYGDMTGHYKMGCSISVMDEFIRYQPAD